jgi:hypothetical protein
MAEDGKFSEVLENSPTPASDLQRMRSALAAVRRTGHNWAFGSFRVPASVQGRAEAKKRNIFQTKRWHSQ